MKTGKLHFLTFGDIPYDQRMLRIWSSLYDAGYEIVIFGRKLTSQDISHLSFKVKRFTPIFEKGFLAYFEYNIRAFFFLLGQKFTILCCIDLDTLPTGYFLKFFRKYRLVYDAHEYFTESPEIVNRPFLKKFWEAVAYICIPKADHCYTVSRSIGLEMSVRYKKNFDLIRNLPIFSEDTIEELSQEHQSSYILYQGAMNVGRGLENLILAMVEVQDKELWLAGEGNLSDALKSLAFENGIQDKVKFLGNLNPEALKSVTEKAWIGINILELIGKSYYFSLANKFFDYIQCGIPQICIDFPEYKTLNDEFEIAIMIPDTKVSNIVTAINKLKSDPELYQKLRSNCFNASSELNWNKESVKLLDIYHNLTT
ncbi:MAG: glycosyltransferase [Saprospiraceae bacterium]|nr:glycosyltransferase [Candidatus Brachybacter algidus]